MRAGDVAARTTLRSALGAIDNAEAVEAPVASPSDGEYVAGAALGVGAAEASRRQLSEADIREILQREVSERLDAAQGYDDSGQPEAATRLRAEAKVLSAYLP